MYLAVHGIGIDKNAKPVLVKDITIEDDDPRQSLLNAAQIYGGGNADD